MSFPNEGQAVKSQQQWIPTPKLHTIRVTPRPAPAWWGTQQGQRCHEPSELQDTRYKSMGKPGFTKSVAHAKTYFFMKLPSYSHKLSKTEALKDKKAGFVKVPNHLSRGDLLKDTE